MSSDRHTVTVTLSVADLLIQVQNSQLLFCSTSAVKKISVSLNLTITGSLLLTDSVALPRVNQRFIVKVKCLLHLETEKVSLNQTGSAICSFIYCSHSSANPIGYFHDCYFLDSGKTVTTTSLTEHRNI